MVVMHTLTFEEMFANLCLGKVKITEEAWYELLEARRELLRKDFSVMTFPSLGDMKCLLGRKYSSREDRKHTINADRYEIKDEKERKILDLRGFFHLAKSVRENHLVTVSVAQDETLPLYNGKKIIWGLSSRGDWAIVEVGFSESYSHDRGESEHAKSLVCKVGVKASDIVALGLTPKKMMIKLSEDMQRVRDRRLELYQNACSLYEKIITQDDLLSRFGDSVEMARQSGR